MKSQEFRLIDSLQADQNAWVSLEAKSLPRNASLRFQMAGLTGSGDLGEARKVSEGLWTDPLLVETDWAHLATANLLATEGRTAEALVYYEKALLLARRNGNFQTELASRIWRELSLAHFGDLASVPNLKKLSVQSQEVGEAYLAMLAASLFVAATVVLDVPMSPGEARVVLKQIDGDAFPGLRAQAMAGLILSGAFSEPEIPARLDETIALALKTQGIKGEPLLFETLEERHHGLLGLSNSGKKIDRWIDRYIRPIRVYHNQLDAELFPSLSETPFLRSANCARCDGRCCYDGVYLTTAEERAIRGFMAEHPEYFTHVPEEFTEDGEWGFLFGGKRTIRRPHRFDSPDYPKHFERTKCIFADLNGECALQKAATENGLHPWKFKPTSCWEFPLIGLFNENAMEHPHYFGVADPGYIDETHPGYVSFMPCATVVEAGISWKKAYKNELQYFLYFQDKKKRT